MGQDKKIKVMIADDDANIVLAIKLIIEADFTCEQIDTAADGLEAWEKIQQIDYDLIISDWNMPRMDGSQLLTLLRKTPQTRSIPFLMLTARKDVESVATAVRAMVTDYVIKPFDKAFLITRIEKLLDIKSSSPVPSTENIKATEPSSIDQKAISLKVMELIGKGVVSLPALPQVVFAIEEALKKQDTKVQDIAKLIEMDAGISSKLIGVANSAYYRGTQECSLVEEAIMRLGIQETRQLICLVSNRNLFALKDRRFEDTIKDLYLHSISCGAASQSLATHLNLSHPYNYFMMGLFHDIGKLLVLKVLSEITKDTQGIDLPLCLSIIDSLHTKAGYMLLTTWEFPQIYSVIALNHHAPTPNDEQEKELFIVSFANLLTKKLGYSLKKHDGEDILNSDAAKRLHLSSDILDKVTADVHNHSEKINSIM